MSSETQAPNANTPMEEPQLDERELEFLEFLFDTLVVKPLVDIHDIDNIRQLAPNNVLLTRVGLDQYPVLCFTNYCPELSIFASKESVLYVNRNKDDELSVTLNPSDWTECKPHLIQELKSLIGSALSVTTWTIPLEAWRNRINFLDFGYLWKHRQFCKGLSIDGQNFDVSTLGRDGWSFITIAGNQAGDDDTFTYGIQTADVSRSCDIVRAHGVNFAPPVKMFRYDAGDILPGPDYRQAKNRFDMVLAQLKKDLVDPAIL